MSHFPLTTAGRCVKCNHAKEPPTRYLKHDTDDQGNSTIAEHLPHHVLQAKAAAQEGVKMLIDIMGWDLPNMVSTVYLTWK